MITKKIVCCMLALGMTLLSGCQAKENTASKGENIETGNKFTLVESDGTKVILDNVPERIIVLSVATAEIMHKLDIPLVGMTSTSRELSEGLRNLPEVGIPMNPDMEKIASLTPDLVVMSTNFKAAHKNNFAQLNLSTYFIDNQRYTDTEKTIEMLAKAFGKEDKIDSVLKPIKDREAVLIESVKNKEKPTVMVIFGTSESFSMARENSFVGDMVRVLGCKNITDDLKIDDAMASMIPLSLEKAVELNPQVILRVAHGNPREVRKLYEKEFETNPLWKSIEAVQNDRVFDLDQQLFFSNPGLTAIDSLEELAKILFP
jgi:iron complex transport system substrate-binding protein